MEWRSIPCFPHYEVSDTGLVRSTDRPCAWRKGGVARGKLLKVSDTRGYARVGMYVDGKQLYRTCHRLVAAAFLGLDINDRATVVDHRDGDTYNNHVDNLRVMSQGMNTHHGGPAYRVLCSLVGQPEADRLIADHVSN